jgi:nitrate reductase gamma subunit
MTGETLNTLAFSVFPYLALTVFVVGHAYRYLTDAWHWNARSSQFLHPESLRYGITVFHWGALLTLVGHAAGMLIPQSLYDMVGITAHYHELMAYWIGLVAGLLMVPGTAWLLLRRFFQERIAAQSSANDCVLLILLLIVGGIGLYNVIFTHYDVLYSVAPWIRGVVTLRPDPTLMAPVPVSYKLHILTALALLAYSPFTRLVHIWSVPVAYLIRSFVLFRRQAAS